MKTTLFALHHQTADWLRELEFYDEELSILQKRLKSAQAKNTNEELNSGFKEFEKRLEELKRDIAERKHDVTVRERVLENLTKENLGHDEKIRTEDGEDVIKNEVKALIYEIADTRFLLNLFLVSAE